MNLACTDVEYLYVSYPPWLPLPTEVGESRSVWGPYRRTHADLLAIRHVSGDELLQLPITVQHAYAVDSSIVHHQENSLVMLQVSGSG